MKNTHIKNWRGPQRKDLRAPILYVGGGGCSPSVSRKKTPHKEFLGWDLKWGFFGVFFMFMCFFRSWFKLLVSIPGSLWVRTPPHFRCLSCGLEAVHANGYPRWAYLRSRGCRYALEHERGEVENPHPPPLASVSRPDAAWSLPWTKKQKKKKFLPPQTLRLWILKKISLEICFLAWKLQSRLNKFILTFRSPRNRKAGGSLKLFHFRL